MPRLPLTPKDHVLRGENQLGRLLSGLRDQIVVFLEEEQDTWKGVELPEVANFRLLGQDLRELYYEVDSRR